MRNVKSVPVVTVEEGLSVRWKLFMGLVSVLALLSLVAVLAAGCGASADPTVPEPEPLGAAFYAEGLEPSAVAWEFLVEVWLAVPDAAFITYSSYGSSVMAFGLYTEDGWLSIAPVPEVAVAEAWSVLYSDSN